MRPPGTIRGAMPSLRAIKYAEFGCRRIGYRLPGHVQHGDNTVRSDPAVSELSVKHLNARLRSELCHVLEDHAGLSLRHCSCSILMRQISEVPGTSRRPFSAD